MTTTIDTIAATLAHEAIAQGLTVEHLTPGWALYDADIDYAREQLGRDLTAEERVELVRAFEGVVRGTVDYKGRKLVPVLRARRFLPTAADFETRWVIAGAKGGQAWSTLERAQEEVDMLAEEAALLASPSFCAPEE